MKKVLGAAAGIVLAVGIWSAPALAEGGKICDGWGGCAQSYGNWGGVRVSDEDCDGQGVYSNYRRDTGGDQVQNNYNGVAAPRRPVPARTWFTGTAPAPTRRDRITARVT